MLLLALVLLTVALISALTAMQLAIHGREVAIPKLVGMTPNEADRAGAASGLQVVIERQFYNPDVPEGRILTQMPPAGTKVRRGWNVRVAQSLGPQRITIPDLTGGSERVAVLNLQRRGLSLGSVAYVSLPGFQPDLSRDVSKDASQDLSQDASEDRVISQSPAANASGVTAPKISLLVSDGAEPPTYVMPNLIGQPLGSVKLLLEDAGMKVGKVTMAPAPTPPSSAPSSATSSAPPSADATQAAPVPPSAGSTPNPASMIVTQAPLPGQKISSGNLVNLEVR